MSRTLEGKSSESQNSQETFSTRGKSLRESGSVVCVCVAVVVRSLIINSSPAMFDSASNDMISVGHFTASQVIHANVTININGV